MYVSRVEPYIISFLQRVGWVEHLNCKYNFPLQILNIFSCQQISFIWRDRFFYYFNKTIQTPKFNVLKYNVAMKLTNEKWVTVNDREKLPKNWTFTAIYAENSISFSTTTAPFPQQKLQVL